MLHAGQPTEHRIPLRLATATASLWAYDPDRAGPGYLVVGLQDASVIVGLAGDGVPIAVFEVDGGCVGRVPVDVAVAPTVSHNTDGLCSCIVGNAAQRWPSVMCNPPHAGTVQLPH